MAIFEELELWDNLIACYRLLQKKPQARCRWTCTTPRLQDAML